MNFNRNLLVSILALCSTTAMAAEAPYHHLHLTATDAAEAAAWYAEHMGGELATGGQRLNYDDVLLIFFVKEDFPGSSGSSVDHIGFSFSDLAEKMRSYEAAGVKILSEVRDVQGKFKFAFVEDPWGTKIEVMEDPNQVGLHHIHLKSPDPEGAFDWYEASFGGTRDSFAGMLPALRYGSLWLLIQNSRGAELSGTTGRAIDHLGWSFPDLDAAAVDLKARGVKFTMEPRPYRNLRIAFIEGPDGVSIELVQPAAD
ncbi:MAG: VOC family protein [Gammaproteobacteria bacterium]|nr:VOC family protein [Gammaproteobacteria bacterium]